MGVSDAPRYAGAIEGAGTLPVAGGGGVAPAGPPIFCSRDLRSIFGFLSSAIVRSRPYVCERQHVNATSSLEGHFLDSRCPADRCGQSFALAAVVDPFSRPQHALARRGPNMRPHVLVVDNYDSFTFNLVQYLGELGAKVDVYKNDAIDVSRIRTLAPDGVLISPGPCTPNEAGVSLDLLRELGSAMSILGVCLGHQAIGQAYGGRVVRASRLMHGKTSPILHDGRGVFAGLPSPFDATRYHSLLVERASMPACLEVSAWTAEGEIMGLRHREHDVEGVQFHPESVLTKEGKRLVENWLKRLGANRPHGAPS